MATESGEITGESTAGPWNSLEKAKLAAAMATPLALFVLGAFVTWQVEESKRQYQESVRLADEQREKRTAAEARRYEERRQAADIIRAKQIRDEAALREQAFNDQAHEREKAFRAENFRRDADSRRAAVERDTSVRREAVLVARYNQLLGKRIEIWERMGPTLSSISSNVQNTAAGRKFDLKGYEAALLAIQNTANVTSPFFSPRFWVKTQDFIDEVARFHALYIAYTIGGQVDSEGLPRVDQRMRRAIDNVSTSYLEVQAAAARELVILDVEDPIA